MDINFETQNLFCSIRKHKLMQKIFAGRICALKYLNHFSILYQGCNSRMKPVEDPCRHMGVLELQTLWHSENYLYLHSTGGWNELWCALRWMKIKRKHYRNKAFTGELGEVSEFHGTLYILSCLVNICWVGLNWCCSKELCQVTVATESNPWYCRSSKYLY